MDQSPAQAADGPPVRPETALRRTENRRLVHYPSSGRFQTPAESWLIALFQGSNEFLSNNTGDSIKGLLFGVALQGKITIGRILLCSLNLPFPERGLLSFFDYFKFDIQRQAVFAGLIDGVIRN